MARKKKKYSAQAIKTASGDNPNYDYMQLLPPHPQTAQLTAQAIQSGGDKSILDKAFKALGSKEYNGLCEKFVETAQGAAGKFASAYDAFLKQKDKVQTDLSKMPPGSQIFYAPDKSNSGWGHTTIYEGGGKQIGATYSGVKSSSISDWTSQTGQKIIGFLPPSA